MDPRRTGGDFSGVVLIQHGLKAGGALGGALEPAPVNVKMTCDRLDVEFRRSAEESGVDEGGKAAGARLGHGGAMVTLDVEDARPFEPDLEPGPLR